jgi:ATP-dependent DNA helicase RecQ
MNAASAKPAADLLPALKRYWGYESFRPMQEKIVRSLLAGRDACVVMPTGGGKSLCYQLPAALLENKTVVVISPLIALMQDQVAQLDQMGIPAAVLNSGVSAKDQHEIMRGAGGGKYRLIYLSPERIALETTVKWLARLPVSFFAIDEAHCISEWGHEFRPEYRQLSKLRKHFPDRPIAAFTASATQRVRHDIVEQLALRDPDKYIASFHRPNLRYVVQACDSGSQLDLLVAALREYEGSSVIVYSPTIKRVSSAANFLKDRGIAAIEYHGKMDAKTRRANQEAWMADEARVLVGTIAFGLGINKPSVRAVIHLSLPKSIEQYYQEAGRAGRDGLPADCILLWQKQDAVLLAYFIGKLTDQAEVDRSWERYRTIRAFVESKTCRHRSICEHFGEVPKWQTCGACDACGYKVKALAAIKVVEAAPAALPKYSAAADSREMGRERRRRKKKEGGPLFEPGLDQALYDHLREWRRTKAKALGVAAFTILHDSSLEDLCRKAPRDLAALRHVSGFGDRKIARYGHELVELIRKFSPARPPRTGPNEIPPRPKSELSKKPADSGARGERGAWWGARAK